MASLPLSRPTLSTPFLPQKFLCNGNKEKTTATYPYIPPFRSFKSPSCAVNAPYEGNTPKFPRVNVWDPYRRLGVSPYASEEEIWGSRNLLLQQYDGHERSVESIEIAFEKLLMATCRERKKTKINLKSRLKKKWKRLHLGSKACSIL